MDIIRLALSFITATIVGLNILTLVIKRDVSFSIPERLALSYLIGLGILTVQMFFYSLADISFSLSALLLPHAAVTIIACFVFLNSTPSGNPPAAVKNHVFDIFLFSGIIFQALHAFFKALIKPMDSFDSIGNFAFKAKLFFMEHRIPYELFSNRSIDIQHPDYPLFISLSETWIYTFLGKWDDLLVKALFPMFFAAFLIIFYFTLKRVIGKRLSLVSTFFLAAIPHFLNYAAIGYGDFALAMFYSLSFIYLFLWISHKREGKYIFLAALFSLLAVWAKNEGAMLSLCNILILLLFAALTRNSIKKFEMRGIIYFILAVTALPALWFTYSLNIMGFANECVNEKTIKLSVALKHLNRIPLILYEYQKHIFGPKKWNISLLVFFAGLIVYAKKAFKGNFKYITFSILFPLLGYSAVYLITPLEIRYHLQTAGSRLLLHFLPLVVFWIGYLAKDILNAENNLYR